MYHQVLFLMSSFSQILVVLFNSKSQVKKNFHAMLEIGTFSSF